MSVDQQGLHHDHAHEHDDAGSGHKAHQAHHFDHEIKDPEFEISRPRGGGRFYTFLMRFKVGTAVRLLRRDLRGQRVLVVCAGSGMDAELLLHFGPDVVALDISEGALARARTRAQRYDLPYTLVVGDAERLPFPNDAFDYAFVHDGLHHLTDTSGAIAEMVRVSRRGVMITEPADAQFTHLATRLGIITELEDSGNEVNRLHPARLRPVFERLGMPIVRYQRYLVKYQHQPAWYSRLLDLPGMYPLARWAFLVFGVRLLGPVGNKLAIVALAPDEPRTETLDPEAESRKEPGHVKASV